MPMPRIENTAAQLDSQTLSSIELELGVELPHEYRVFLLQHNGGEPVPPYFRIGKGGSQLSFFLSVGAERAIFDLVSTTHSFRSRIPAELLPVGEDAGGNFVCIGVSGEHRGKVFFWDHEEERENPGFHNVGKIAESFSDFLEGFHE